jgi:hypothetical protein
MSHASDRRLLVGWTDKVPVAGRYREGLALWVAGARPKTYACRRAKQPRQPASFAGRWSMLERLCGESRLHRSEGAGRWQHRLATRRLRCRCRVNQIDHR